MDEIPKSPDIIFHTAMNTFELANPQASKYDTESKYSIQWKS